MSLDLTDARAAFQEFMLPDEAVVTVPGVPTSDGGGSSTPGTPTTFTSPCAVNPVSGNETAEAVVKVRGAYRIDLPWATAITEGATIAALGRRFRVVWAPPAGGLDLARTVGATEI